jgi:hypothetical protein
VSRHTNYAVPAHALVQNDATSVKNVECLGCPSTSKTDENVVCVKEPVLEKRRIIVCEFAKMLEISFWVSSMYFEK